MLKQKLYDFFKIVSINLLVFIIFLILLELMVFRFLYPSIEMGNFNPETKLQIVKNIINETNFEELYGDYRTNYGLSYDSKAIMLFGCSYAFGHALKDEETFHYKLANQLKRPVYNYAISGQSTQFALMKIRSKTIDEVIKKSEYAVLVTIGEHFWRIYANSNGFPINYVWPRYEEKEGKLIFHKTRSSIIEGSCTYKYFRKLFYARFCVESENINIKNKLFDFMKLHYMEIQRELKQINPDIKIVIIPYKDSDDYTGLLFSERWRELEDEGFIVVQVDKYLPYLRELEYVISETDGHPSGKAWTEIVDLMCNKLKVFN